MGAFVIPGLNRQPQAAVNPSGPIPGAGAGIAPVAPPVGQVAPPTAPALPPVNTMAPRQVGVGGRILSGLGTAFLGPQVMREIPGTTNYNQAMQAQGLMLKPPTEQRSTGSRIARGVLGGLGGNE